MGRAKQRPCMAHHSVYQTSLTNFQQISGRYPWYIFLKFQKIFTWSQFAMSINEHVTLTPEIIVILFTRRLPYVQCTKNRLTCKNYIANHKIFRRHQLNSRRLPVFPGAISNSRRFPGVVDTRQKSSSRTAWSTSNLWRISSVQPATDHCQ